MTLIKESMHQFLPTSRTFHLSNKNNEKNFIEELLRRPVPDLMIKIIGQSYDQSRRSFQASIDEAFRQVMREIMEQTSEF